MKESKQTTEIKCFLLDILTGNQLEQLKLKCVKEGFYDLASEIRAYQKHIIIASKTRFGQ